MSLRDNLQLGHYQPEDAIEGLKEYREILAYRFDEDRRRSKFSMADFWAHEKGQQWQDNVSCLLMLSGRNERGVQSFKECWLSPMVADLILDKLQKGQKVAFETCDEPSTLQVVLSRLIFQLLEKSPLTIRKAEDNKKIHSYLVRPDPGREEALSEALLSVINLQKEVVYIILDRPELSQADSLDSFAQIMLNVVKRAEVPLKVLIVYRAELEEWTPSKKGTSKDSGKPQLCLTLRIDQERL